MDGHKYIRTGFLRKKTTRYKPIWCNHADWLILKTISSQLGITMIETIHKILNVYIKYTSEKFERQIESLENQKVILAAEVKRYQDRFGIIKD